MYLMHVKQMQVCFPSFVLLALFVCVLIDSYLSLLQVKPALPALAGLIHSNDEEVLTDACWALSYLSDGTNDKIQGVIDAGVCTRLVELLSWVPLILIMDVQTCMHSHAAIQMSHSYYYSTSVQAPFPFSAYSCSSHCWKYCYWRWCADAGIKVHEFVVVLLLATYYTGYNISHYHWLFCCEGNCNGYRDKNRNKKEKKDFIE